MKTITFECQTITPMFLAGADGKTPELRPPSIKGALRFWWRAMNGDLSLTELKKKESEIFGGTNPAQRSNIVIIIKNHREAEKELSLKNNKPVPHKNFQISSIVENQKFNVILKNINENIITTENLSSLFQLTFILGGIGKRERRGMGSLKINRFRIEDENWIENNNIITIENINNLLNTINKYKFLIKNDVIQSKFNRDEKYPYIKSIEIGKSNNNSLLSISNKTSELHSNAGYKYAMGYADKFGRFASPIFVSIINDNQAIITTLNTITPNNGNFDENIQNDFKNSILK